MGVGGAEGAGAAGLAVGAGRTGPDGEPRQNSLVRKGFSGRFRSGLPRTFGEESA
ncbi:hypothetical protein J3A78_000200 [Streptomyces sp. PvR006]|nr:hypothetical protein [Streptomyces sp. PvR006]